MGTSPLTIYNHYLDDDLPASILLSAITLYNLAGIVSHSYSTCCSIVARTSRLSGSTIIHSIVVIHKVQHRIIAFKYANPVIAFYTKAPNTSTDTISPHASGYTYVCIISIYFPRTLPDSRPE